MQRETMEHIVEHVKKMITFISWIVRMADHILWEVNFCFGMLKCKYCATNSQICVRLLYVCYQVWTDERTGCTANKLKVLILWFCSEKVIFVWIKEWDILDGIYRTCNIVFKMFCSVYFRCTMYMDEMRRRGVTRYSMSRF